MTKENFINEKELLINFIKSCYDNSEISPETLASIKHLEKILTIYSYDNRLKMKGLMSRTIVDSMELEPDVYNRFIGFEKCID